MEVNAALKADDLQTLCPYNVSERKANKFNTFGGTSGKSVERVKN